MRGGEGESQLESDRRRVQERIDKITDDLQVVRRQRATQRNGRQRNLWPLASIVGYTNAGKSTLLNALTGAAVLAEDKLFATLDPTTRRLRLPTNQNVFLTDTVGFIRKLPHGLVEAFKATLEEVVQAELLVHVVDVSHPQAAEQIAAVNQVLAEIGAGGKPTLMVFNKIDQFTGNGSLEKLLQQFPSLRRHFRQNRRGPPGLDRGIEHPTAPHPRVRRIVRASRPFRRHRPFARSRASHRARLRRRTGALPSARIPPHFHAEFAPFIVQELHNGAANGH